MIPGHSKVEIAERLKHIKPSATLAINEKSKALQSKGKKIVRFGLGQSPFPVPAIVVQALKDNAHQKDYLNTKGLEPLRIAVADYHKRVNQLEFSSENIQIGPGSKELIYDILLALDATLLLASPSWVSYEPQGRLAGINFEWIPCSYEGQWKLTAEAFEQACKNNPGQKVSILNYPNNPTGQSYTKEELETLAGVARKYKVVIIADEIYGALSFDSNHSIAEYYPEGTIVTAGLSKWCGAGGWRLGTAAFPESLKDILNYMSIIASETYTSVSAPIQYAAITAFQKADELDLYLDKSNRILKIVSSYCQQKLSAAGLSLHPTMGGFYLFVSAEPKREILERRGIKDSTTLAENMLEEIGVAVLPGMDFGRPAEEFTFRLAFVDFDGEQALQLIDSNLEEEDFINRCCQDIKIGIEQLNNYFH